MEGTLGLRPSHLSLLVLGVICPACRPPPPPRSSTNTCFLQAARATWTPPPAEPVCQSAAEQPGSQSQPASLGSQGAQSTASDVEEALKTFALPLLPVIRQGCEALKQSLRGAAVGSVSLPVCFPFHFLIFC